MIGVSLSRSSSWMTIQPSAVWRGSCSPPTAWTSWPRRARSPRPCRPRARVTPTAALVDVELPDGDGFALAGELTAMPWSPRVVVTSVQSGRHFPAEARRNGAEAFVLKADLADGAAGGMARGRGSAQAASGGRVAAMTAPRRVAIGEDDVLLREGIARVLALGGFEVVAEAGDADDLLRKGLAHRPDLLVTDISMPPGRGDDGLRGGDRGAPAAAGDGGARALAVLRGALRHRAAGRRRRGRRLSAQGTRQQRRRVRRRRGARRRGRERARSRDHRADARTPPEAQEHRRPEPARARSAGGDGRGEVEPRDRGRNW